MRQNALNFKLGGMQNVQHCRGASIEMLTCKKQLIPIYSYDVQ
jgi:hypothetical protein